ncbi:hypothetical protein EVAR_97727_1 [Eumeta japonica]|uniref:Uncharacterized protein n=1 Tax=Eumeta variegata TaxID=151549 RepID=A0A4C1XZ07_EUMVA|nr:hypothetical protein EVAR_97727_1 [Eumeta japonica]
MSLSISEQSHIKHYSGFLQRDGLLSSSAAQTDCTNAVCSQKRNESLLLFHVSLTSSACRIQQKCVFVLRGVADAQRMRFEPRGHCVCGAHNKGDRLRVRGVVACPQTDGGLGCTVGKRY